MPLDRGHITVPSRIMLPADFALCVGFGLTYVITPHALAQAAAIQFQGRYLPLWCWGAFLLAIAALMAIGWAGRRRMVFAFALALASVTWLVWGATYAAAIFTDGATPLGPMFCGYVAVAHVASIYSLVRGDR
jgi:hypothetical protein